MAKAHVMDTQGDLTRVVFHIAVPNGNKKRFGTARPSAANRPAGWCRRIAAPAQAFITPPASSTIDVAANTMAVAAAEAPAFDDTPIAIAAIASSSVETPSSKPSASSHSET